MAKTQKLYINYSAPRSRCAEALSGADETDLSILGGLFLLSTEDGELDTSALEASGKFEKADIRASIKYWRGAGVLCTEVQSLPTQGTDMQAQSPEQAHAAPAHKDGVITHSGVEKYTNAELADVLSRSVGTAFVDEAQKAMGKMFNNGEVGKLVGLVDQLGFEEEAVLAILSYCVRIGKRSLSYAEKLAVSFHDEDILTTVAVHEKIDYLERRDTALEKVRSLFGFGGRALSATEKKLFTAWTLEYGFGMDIITRAYDLTVDAIQSPAPKYTDKILTKWHDKGLKTLEEVNAFIEEEKKNAKPFVPADKSKSTSTAKDEKVDEWLEKRLQQIFK